MHYHYRNNILTGTGTKYYVVTNLYENQHQNDPLNIMAILYIYILHGDPNIPICKVENNDKLKTQ